MVKTLARGFVIGGNITGYVLSAADRLLMPGLISAHTHSHGALNRDAVDDRVSLGMSLTGGASGVESRGVTGKYLSTAEMICSPLTSVALE